MTDRAFDWCGRSIPFRPGETIGAALLAAGIADLGHSGPTAGRYFCGIGACQGCTVLVDGVIREACLTPAAADTVVAPMALAGRRA